MAAIVCTITVFTAFMTFTHVLDERNPRRHAWQLVTGLCSATGIWAIHFVVMLAFQGRLPLHGGGMDIATAPAKGGPSHIPAGVAAPLVE